MSHLNGGSMSAAYNKYILWKLMFLIFAGCLLAALLVVAVSLGPVPLPLSQVLRVLLEGPADSQASRIVWNIRLPQALAGLVAGAGLAAAGVSMQSILRNPLGSPFTLGISSAAAFGAAFSLVVFDPGSTVLIDRQLLTALMAFAFCLLAALVIIAISRFRGANPETLVLAGVAVGSLFLAGTMFLQYFADDVQLATMVFWTFGDLSRASWPELGMLSFVVLIGIVWFSLRRWDYNSIDSGDETAFSLGVNVKLIRLEGMLLACLVTAVIVSVLGVIGFVGLVCPHMARRLIGDDHRFLLLGSCLLGAGLMVAADTAARMVLAPHALPVSILTAFIGAPVFVFLIVRGYH